MRVIISGGGTGGHIYPALALVQEIKKHDPHTEILYIGTQNGLESAIVRKAKIPFKTIDVTGFRRKLSFENIKTVVKFLQSVQKSKQIIRQFQPDIVIGTGGYVCGPVVFAATKLRVPTLIHEQNVIPGLTNQFLARYSSAVAVSFEGSLTYFKHPLVRVTGNPRASEVVQADPEAGRKRLSLTREQKLILIVGGSRGAKAINEAFMQMLPYLHQLEDCHFLYITGEVHYNAILNKFKSKRVDEKRVTIEPFVHNLPQVLAATDLIVNRAGASFLAEITALGIPSILIPSPYVTNNHQEKNARWLENEGASCVILESELTGERLFEKINQVISHSTEMKRMSNAARNLGKPNAAGDLIELIQNIINRK